MEQFDALNWYDFQDFDAAPGMIMGDEADEYLDNWEEEHEGAE